MSKLDLYKQSKIPIYSDNSEVLLLAYNSTFYERTKYIAVKYYYIRDLINKGIIELIYISTKDQKADRLTKSLGKIKFKDFILYLSLI